MSVNIRQALELGQTLGLQGVRILVHSQQDPRLTVRTENGTKTYFQCHRFVVHRDTIRVNIRFHISQLDVLLTDDESRREFYDAVFVHGVNHEGLHAGGYMHVGKVEQSIMKSLDLQAIGILRKHFGGFDRLIGLLGPDFERRFSAFPNDSGRWPCPLGAERRRAAGIA